MNSCIAGIGECLWDLFPEGKLMGGAPANFAFHAKQLMANEADCYVISCIGDDELGKQLSHQLKSMSLETEFLFRDRRHKTGTVTVSVENTGLPSYTIEKDAAWDFIPQLPTKLAESVDAICYGTLAQREKASREAIQAFLGSTRPGALRIFDINLRQNFYSEQILTSSLGWANVLKINHEELSVISELLGVYGSEEEIMRRICAAFELKLGVLTKGGCGSILVTNDRVSVHSGYPVRIVDSVGAGDAFTACIAVGLLRGEDLDRINDQANRVASFVCSKAGATPVLPIEVKPVYTKY